MSQACRQIFAVIGLAFGQGRSSTGVEMPFHAVGVELYRTAALTRWGSQVRSLSCPPPSLPKPATDSSLAEKPFLRPFLACGGLRFPVSARRRRLRAPFGGPVSGGKNPVPNSIWRRVPDEMHGIYAGKIFRSQPMTIKTAAGRVRSPSDLPRADRPAIRPVHQQ